MTNYYNPTWFSEVGTPEIGGPGAAFPGSFDLNTWINQDQGIDLWVFGLCQAQDGHTWIMGDDTGSDESDFTPWLEGQTPYDTPVSATNPLVWFRVWAVDQAGDPSTPAFTRGDSVATTPTLTEAFNSTGSLTLPNGTEAGRALEWGTRIGSVGWGRTTENKSTSGTDIIPVGDIAWGAPPTFLPAGLQLQGVNVTVSGALALTMKMHWHDYTDPGGWNVSAAYGFVPNSKTTEQTTRTWENWHAWAVDSADTLTMKSHATSGNSHTMLSNYFPSAGGLNGRPFAVEIINTTAGTKSFWAFTGNPTAPGVPGVTDPNAGGDGGGGLQEDGPALDPNGPSYGGLDPGDTPTGSGHKPWVNVDDPQAPRIVIDDPTGSPVDLPPGTGLLPPGTAGDAPITLIVVGRLLYVYYGGNIITTYLIPQAIWDALPTATKQYIGYTNAAGEEISAPLTVTIALVGYIFGAGSYRARLQGRTSAADGHLWRNYPQWFQEKTKDYLVTSGATTVVEAPTQDEIDAADKHIAGGREGQTTLTYIEAIQAADAFNAAIVVPVAP